MIRDCHEVEPDAATGCCHVSWRLPAVGVGRVHVSVALERNTAHQILPDGVNPKLSHATALGTLDGFYDENVLLLTLKELRYLQRPVHPSHRRTVLLRPAASQRNLFAWVVADLVFSGVLQSHVTVKRSNMHRRRPVGRHDYGIHVEVTVFWAHVNLLR